jgi:protein-disulfide isomerase
MEENQANNDTITLNVKPVKNFLTKIPKHNWAVFTYILIIVVVILLIMNLNSGGLTGNVISEKNIANEIETFINTQLIQEGGVLVESITEESGVYTALVNIDGETLPIYFTRDGKFITQGRPLQSILAAGGNIPTTEKAEVTADDDAIKGDLNAPVTIIEFSDYECPFCAKFYTETYSQIVQNYIDTGKAKIIFRDFPLSFHQNAQKASEAAECVRNQGGDEAYWKMHDLLFENQADLSLEKIKSLAQGLNYNIDSCLDSGEMEAEVLADLEAGSLAGVSGTPAFFINGIKIEGAQPYANFEATIEAALAETEI